MNLINHFSITPSFYQLDSINLVEHRDIATQEELSDLRQQILHYQEGNECDFIIVISWDGNRHFVQEAGSFISYIKLNQDNPNFLNPTTNTVIKDHAYYMFNSSLQKFEKINAYSPSFVSVLCRTNSVALFKDPLSIAGTCQVPGLTQNHRAEGQLQIALAYTNLDKKNNVEKNVEIGRRYFKRALNNQSDKAVRALERIYQGVKQQNQYSPTLKFESWLYASLLPGNKGSDALSQLILCYEKGIGCLPSLEKAEELKKNLSLLTN